MTEKAQQMFDLGDQAAQELLGKALRNTLIVGALGAVAVWIGAGWRDAAMLLTGTIISGASILEWQRLAKVISAALDQNRIPRNAPGVVVLFVLRLTLYAGAIYGSLRCFKGSVVALLCGLGLAALAILWQAIRLLLD
jgi:small-conductance mechanosensitive channel